MRISIFGLGYVGVVSAACLASRGHAIVGVDINPDKVAMLDSGISPIVEAGLPELLAAAQTAGTISATPDAAAAVLNTEISLICVGTPSRPNGSLNMDYLESVTREIAAVLSKKATHHLIVFRSTMVPGTCRDVLIPLLESVSGKTEGQAFSVAFNPEFLREASAVFDFNNPPKTVAGARTSEVARQVMDLYAGLPGPMISTSLEVAEMVKYVDNNFHALKITFANEIGQVCHSLGIDSHAVMDIFVQDTKLNISAQYLKPGFAFGGSCLPKDLRAITYLARTHDLNTPLLQSMIPSNQHQIQSVIDRIIASGKKRIGIAGFSFKAGTDDLRESPIVELIEVLLGKGFELKVYDQSVSLSRLIGANKDFLNQRIPHIASLMVESLTELTTASDLIVIGNKAEAFKSLITDCRTDQLILDLVRIVEPRPEQANYIGLYW